MNIPANTLFDRRRFLACMTTVFVAAPVIGLAHDGHGVSRVVVDAKVLKVRNGTIRLRFELLNLDSNPIDLVAVEAKGAGRVTLPSAMTVKGFDAGEVVIELRFPEGVPGVFTAILDFGIHGQGPVVVMP